MGPLDEKELTHARCHALFLFHKREPSGRAVAQHTVNQERLRLFVADSLTLWGVDGSVQDGCAPVILQVQAGGRTIYVERAPSGIPFRWLVRDTRIHPCASWLGVLSALRNALGVDRGVAVRVAGRP